MTIFKSQQANLDPEPWLYQGVLRVRPPSRLSEHYAWAPRPEYEPTRDPWPYVNPMDGSRWYAEDGVCWPESGPDAGLIHEWSNVLKWAPRREQFDTPVNRVLVEFRQGWSHDPTYGAANWLESLDDPAWPVESVRNASPEEINHARRVLTRLANWKEQ